MSVIKNVLIAGASGSVGSVLLNELLSSNKFNVVVLSRIDSTSKLPSNVQVVRTDYTATSLSSVFSSFPASSRIDAVICNFNGLALSQPQLALIDAAKNAGVKRFVPSEFGSDSTNERVVGTVGFYFTLPRKAVEHLKSKEGDRFEWTSFINGLFLDWGLQYSFLPVNYKEKKFYLWDDGSVPFSVTNVTTVGKALVSLLSSPERLAATANKHIYIAAHTITLNDLFDAVKKATPDERWTVEQVNSQAAGSKAQEDVSKGDFFAGFELIKYVTYGNGLGALGDLRKNGLSNDLLGLEKEDFEANVKNTMEEIMAPQEALAL